MSNMFLCHCAGLKLHTDPLRSVNIFYLDLVMTYGDIDLGLRWLRSWLVALLTPSNVALSSVRSDVNNQREFLFGIPQLSITKICLKIIDLKFHSNSQGTMSWYIHKVRPWSYLMSYTEDRFHSCRYQTVPWLIWCTYMFISNTPPSLNRYNSYIDLFVSSHIEHFMTLQNFANQCNLVQTWYSIGP